MVLLNRESVLQERRFALVSWEPLVPFSDSRTLINATIYTAWKCALSMLYNSGEEGAVAL
jgi:hypothetical protein